MKVRLTGLGQNCRWDPDGSVDMLVAPPQQALIDTAAASNEGRSIPPLRWDDSWDDEEDEIIAADEGFNERCTKDLIQDAM